MQQVNKHAIEFEPPDLMHVTLNGPLRLEDVSDVGWHAVQGSKEFPYVLLLIDISLFEYDGTTPESRRVMAEVSRNLRYRGVALLGGRGPERLLFRFVLRAVNLFTRGDNPFRFFETEQEARAWLDERRRAIRAEAAAGRGRAP